MSMAGFVTGVLLATSECVGESMDGHRLYLGFGPPLAILSVKTHLALTLQGQMQ